ncbi:MAG TPA: tRNA (N(6)-L-threonylcarbamoyladenosine(37)-C(2))-methylthiotransferase MtaB [Actinomycetota bacterium]|nr:tRNA (N(6)-L-threonylcarbamoyladenosine(37)-C(2))-methylthiotransferase MtaB [Actinomycetota bacterium]
MPSVSFSTLGCRLNQAESDQMAEQLAAQGLGPPTGDEEPQMIIINTCTVTREATKASRMAIRRAVKSHPGATVVVAGCYAVSNPDEVEAIDGVDMIVGNDDKERIGEILAGAPATRPLLQIGRPPAVPAQAPRVRANLKAQTGCDEWCSFCIIPTTRGPLRSMDEDDLVAEAERRVASGARELVLTGVHLGKYSYDHGGNEGSLVRLFERLMAIEGVYRLRLSSILSRHLTNEVISFIAAEPRMCRYLHVPMQSGDDDVLSDMNRPYRIDDYIDAIERARAAIPQLALATDIIVGFPTEGDAAFTATMDVVARLRFSKLHVFRYSPRPDTRAAAMPDAVPSDVKKQRSKELIDLGNSIRRRFLEDHLGTPLEVLVEDERDIQGVNVCSGQTGDYVRVWFEGRGLLGRLVSVSGHEIRADGIRGADLIEARV